MYDYDLYAMEYGREQDVHFMDTLVNMMNAFGVYAHANYDGRMVTVYDLGLDVVKEVVGLLGDAVHDAGHDYEYGYDEYNDPLEVVEDRVVVYCAVNLYSVRD